MCVKTHDRTGDRLDTWRSYRLVRGQIPPLEVRSFATWQPKRPRCRNYGPKDLRKQELAEQRTLYLWRTLRGTSRLRNSERWCLGRNPCVPARFHMPGPDEGRVTGLFARTFLKNFLEPGRISLWHQGLSKFAESGVRSCS